MKIRLRLVENRVGGIDYPLPMVRLRVRDRYGLWAPMLFRVDTQADLTTLPITLARQEGVPFREHSPGRARGFTGAVRKYRDRIHFLIAGREHDWPCDFMEAALDPETGKALPGLTPVLGRAGFLQDYAIRIDDGFLIVTRLGPLRRWWRRLLHQIWEWCGMIHPVNEPL